LILSDHYKDYVPEVKLMKKLSDGMTRAGWVSRTRGCRYPNSSLRADMCSAKPAEKIDVVCEAKQYIRNYPSELVKGRIWSESLIKQHLGIIPGKLNNAVHDVQKLSLADSKYVAFLLMRVEAYANSGEDDIRRFVALSGLDRGPWGEPLTESWTHPTDPAYRFICHLWVRAYRVP
jgi:hypothetical protein